MPPATTTPLDQLLTQWAELEPGRCRKAAGGHQLWLGTWTALEGNCCALQVAVERAIVARGWCFMHQASEGSHGYVVQVFSGRELPQGFPARDAEPEVAALRAYLMALRMAAS